MVGFLKNSKEQPVILRIFHDISEDVGDSNYKNILPNYFSQITNVGDIFDYVHVSPIQDFTTVDRFGNFEISSHTKSFFVAKDPAAIDDEGFDYEDLSIKSPKNKGFINPLANIPRSFVTDLLYDANNPLYTNPQETVTVETVHVEEKYSKPKKYMAVFRDKFVDTATNWLKIIVNAAKTSFRLIKFQQDINTNTSFELTENGGIKIRRQLDTRKLFDPTVPRTTNNLTQNPSKVFTELNLLSDGTIKLETLTDYPMTQEGQTQQGSGSQQNSSGQTQSGGTSGDTGSQQSSSGTTSQTSLPAGTTDDFYSAYPKTTITIAPMGGNITINTTSKLAAYAKNGIEMASPNDIAINSNKTVSINAVEGINMKTTEQSISMVAQKNIQMNATNEGISMRAKQNIESVSQKAINMSSAEGITAASKKDVLITSQTSTSVTSTGNVKMYAPDVKMQGKMDMKGSMAMKGQIGMTGNAKFTGKHTINGRGAILNGDIDTRGKRNIARFSSFIVSILESFCVDQITQTLAEQFPQSSAVLGMLNQTTNGFQMMNMNFNGLATNLENMAFGEIIGQNSPYYQQLIQYCVDNARTDLFGNTINLDPRSVTAQLEFMENGLGINMSNLSGDISITEQPFLATITAVNNLWNAIGKNNNVRNDTTIAIQKSSEFTLTDEQKQHSNTSQNIGSGELDELANLVNVAELPKEGDRVTSGGSGSSGSGSSSGNNSDDNQDVSYLTIEDVLLKLQQYTVNLVDQVVIINGKFDELTGLNTSQYATTNRKVATQVANSGSSSGSGSGSSTHTETRPATITTLEQYVDRAVKRYQKAA